MVCRNFTEIRNIRNLPRKLCHQSIVIYIRHWFVSSMKCLPWLIIDSIFKQMHKFKIESVEECLNCMIFYLFFNGYFQVKTTEEHKCNFNQSFLSAITIPKIITYSQCCYHDLLAMWEIISEISAVKSFFTAVKTLTKWRRTWNN